jgi:hypothetical protein
MAEKQRGKIMTVATKERELNKSERIVDRKDRDYDRLSQDELALLAKEFEGNFSSGGRKNLPEFKARDGMEQRWINTEISDDAVYTAIQTGMWQPRKVETLPMSHELTKRKVNGIDALVVRGQILMERPLIFGEIERKKTQEKTEFQIDGVRAGVPDIDNMSGGRNTFSTKEHKITRSTGFEPIIDEN